MTVTPKKIITDRMGKTVVTIAIKNETIVGDSTGNSIFDYNLEKDLFGNLQRDVVLDAIHISSDYDAMIEFRSGNIPILPISLWNGFSINLTNLNIPIDEKKIKLLADSLETQTTRIDGVIVLKEV